ncbi:DNA double-strand break repair nuclease NurA [Methanolobus profundi]|uniref:NurA domain-containing protein n=1 Tax=Methanolobus profundi TaxID=487685 RepID=A0A1I4QK89_9EURY|nr:DNA double-strand break repair nuclease NurA [Methanolobus profundi]SFM40447.1 hypothetical protein SAMN04488696_1065 [Methanolobus profundi]
MHDNDSPFSQLPEALVENMLSECENISSQLFTSFDELISKKEDYRQILIDSELLKPDTYYIQSPTYPTVCGVDGAYSLEKLLFTDIIAVAAVAVEGLTPPTEERYWPIPRHIPKILNLSHSAATETVGRALMMCFESSLAKNAPHDIVLLDGSFTTPFIHISQAFYRIKDSPEALSHVFLKQIDETFENYYSILSSRKTDQMFVSIPKYTTRKEVSKKINIQNTEDRGILSLLLNPGEVVGPMPMEVPSKGWNIENSTEKVEMLREKVVKELKELQILYYKPYIHCPAIRIEISTSIAKNRHRLGILLEGIKSQSSIGLLEPYPLYLADRMVKNLNVGLPAIRKTATQNMAINWDGSLGDLYLSMHGYRTG